MKPFYIGDTDIYDYQVFGFKRWNTYSHWVATFGNYSMLIG